MSPTLPPRPLRVQSDARLAELARSGEPRAFEALVRRYRRPLLGYCRGLSLGDAQAEDALQQGLLQAWRALRRGDQVSDVKSWLYRIVHNTALDALRRPGRDHVELDELRHGHAAPSSVSQLERRLAVREAMAGLAALPEMQREALLRTAVHGDTHEQVASALGLSHAAVRGLVHRARVAMRAAALALVPARAVQWAERSAPDAAGGLGAAAGGPDTALTGGVAAGMLGAFAKGAAILAGGGMLATGLAATHGAHAHAHPRPSRAPSVGLATARRLSAARTTSSIAAAAAVGGRSSGAPDPGAAQPFAHGRLAPPRERSGHSIRLVSAAPASPPRPVLAHTLRQTVALSVPAQDAQPGPTDTGALQPSARDHGRERRGQRDDQPQMLADVNDNGQRGEGPAGASQDSDGGARDGSDGGARDGSDAGTRHGSDSGSSGVEAGRAVPVAMGNGRQGFGDAPGASVLDSTGGGRGSGRETAATTGSGGAERETVEGTASGSSNGGESPPSSGSADGDGAARATSGS